MSEAVNTAKVVFKRVALVVDDGELRTSLEKLLTEGPYLPITASSAKHALAVLESWEFTPGLIIVDEGRDAQSVTGFLADLRRRERFADVAVLLLAGTRHAGPTQLPTLRKPFTAADFKAAVREHFRVR
jgi:DNA-binding response OmpR family regulator